MQKKLKVYNKDLEKFVYTKKIKKFESKFKKVNF